MIHGFACGGDMWRPLSGLLEARGWRCDAPTLFQHLRTIGCASTELAHLKLGDYVRAAEDYARQLGDEDGTPPIIIGHGMGGLIAQKLVERDVASGAIFMSPFAPADCGPAFRSGAVAYANILLTPASERAGAVIKPWRQGAAWGMLHGLPKAMRDDILDRLRFESGSLFNELETLESESTGAGRIDTQAIRTPTLTVAAERDRVSSARIVRKIAEKYAAAPCPGTFIEYSGVGHWLPDGQALNRLVHDFDNWMRQVSNCAPVSLTASVR